MSKKDAYEAVTARILEALEAGIVPWHRPWKSIGGTGPTSLATGKPYQGVNVFILEATAALRGYSSRYWATFNQVKTRGGKVRKGETGTAIVFWKIIDRENADDERERIPFLRYFTVFNAEQCDGLEVPAEEPMPEFDPIEAAESIADGMPNRPTVNHGGDQAYYSPGLDYVQMPLRVAFTSPQGYYTTLFHELSHSTGHSSRLHRPTLSSPAPFGTPDYSKEELVAEMAAAFLCGQA